MTSNRFSNVDTNVGLYLIHFIDIQGYLTTESTDFNCKIEDDTKMIFVNFDV